MVWGFCYLRIFKNNGENNCKPDHNRSKLLGHWLVKDK
jgi:hypothetical protein